MKGHVLDWRGVVVVASTLLMGGMCVTNAVLGFHLGLVWGLVIAGVSLGQYCLFQYQWGDAWNRPLFRYRPRQQKQEAEAQKFNPRTATPEQWAAMALSYVDEVGPGGLKLVDDLYTRWSTPRSDDPLDSLPPPGPQWWQDPL